jgi:hypothetical protein
MKKIIFISFLSFFITNLNAQVSEYTSYQSAMIKRNTNGEFQTPNEWINRKMKIILDLEKKKLQFSPSNLLGEYPDIVEQEIQLYSLKARSKNSEKKGFATFTGTDKSGEKCIIRFNFMKGMNDIYDGLLQIEYLDTQYAYKIRKTQN